MKTLLLLSAPILMLTACSESQPPQKNTTEAHSTQQWKEKHLSAQQASDLLSSTPSVKVLDVRTPEEYAEGHLKNAINIDFKSSDFAKNLGKIDKSTPYVIHCRSGNRSTQSLATFQKLGFQNIYHLDGGINAWNAANLPTVQ